LKFAICDLQFAILVKPIQLQIANRQSQMTWMSNFFNNYFFILLAIAAGMMIPTQAAINNELATFVESPVLSAFISFIVGTLALFLYILATGIPLGNLANAKSAPPIAWIGGILGAFFVALIVVLVPKIGVALTFSLIVAGQMLVALVIDHFGFLGVDGKPINLMRVLGATLITAGVILIRKF
jgi:transporter family-2 protein